MEITTEFIRDPYPTYARMRASDAAHWSDANGGTWFIPRYADVTAGFLEPRFSSARKAEAAARQFSPELSAEFEPAQRVIREWLVLLDPPKHLELRKLMNRGFVRAIIDSLKPRVQEVADRLVDDIQRQTCVDFVEAFARPLPGQIICHLLGVEESAREDFMRWSEDVVSFGGSLKPSVELFRQAQRSILSMLEYFSRLVPERRARKGQDLISLLLQAEESELVSPNQMLANCIQLIFAGHETTRNLLANGLYLLLTHPDQLRMLRAAPELLPDAILEFLRFESPLQLIRRVVDVDMEWGGKQMRVGDGVVLMTGSANRDSNAFPEPDELDIRRAPVRHIAYGHGIHRCVGAALATMEAEVGFATLLRRLPQLRLTGEEPQRLTNPMLRGLSELRISAS